MSDPIPRVLIELLALGELDPEEAQRVRLQLGDDLERELQAIARSNAELLARYPHASDRTVAPTRRGKVFYLVTSVAVAATLLAGVGIVRLLREAPPSPLDSGLALRDELPQTGAIRHKGQPVLLVFRPESRDPLRDGDRVEAGQLLQLSYNAAGASHGVIVSIDGRGNATLHLPATPEGDTTLQSGEHRLDHAFELDDAPRFERFFFVTANADLDAGKVYEAATQLTHEPEPTASALGLPEGWKQTSLLLLK